MEEIFKEELKDVLSSFQKDKKLGLEGFPIKFYPGSYDLIEEDILGVVEESRVTGAVNKVLNLTFIVLIPKFNCPSTLGYFRPIALCNLCYKIISVAF